jgi:hypothetical protein
MATIKCEGQEFDMPLEIAKDNKMLIDTMVAYFPGIANAEIKRTGEGDAMVVTMIKRAGTKGWNEVEQVLVDAREHINPAVAMQHEMNLKGAGSGTMTVREMLEMRPQIDKALEAGNKEVAIVEHSAKALARAAAVPAGSVVKGF